jgi:hypothetical protein
MKQLYKFVGNFSPFLQAIDFLRKGSYAPDKGQPHISH